MTDPPASRSPDTYVSEALRFCAGIQLGPPQDSGCSSFPHSPACGCLWINGGSCRECSIPDERIGGAFVSEGRHRPVAGNEGRLAAHRPEALRDGFDQLLVIAHREVPPSYRPFEQHVADDRKVRFRMMEDDMAGRVAGAVAHVEGQIANRHRVAVIQPTVRLERLAFDAPTLSVVVEPRD